MNYDCFISRFTDAVAMSGNIALALDCGRYTPGDFEGNLSMITESIRKAVASGCDIICFPEACITGYSTTNVFTVSEDSDCLKALSDISKEITVVIGAFEKADKDFITQFVFFDGRIIGRYRKTHLGMNETIFEAGNILQVFEADGYRMGIQLCWEIHFPQITAKYRNQDAILILNPTASGLPPERRMSLWRKVIPARADDNRLFYAACNSDGSSVLCCGPDGSEIEGKEIGEHLFRYDLDLSKVEKYRVPEETMRNIDYPKHFRPELYDLE